MVRVFGRVRQHNKGTPTPTSFFWFLVPALAGKPPWSGPKSPRRVGTQANADRISNAAIVVMAGFPEHLFDASSWSFPA